MLRLHHHRRSLLLVVIMLASALPAFAAEPVIRNLNVRGLAIGGKTTLIVDGDDLGTAPRLLLPFACQQELLPKGTDKQATFVVTLGGEVVPGYHHLRLTNEGGVSLPVVIGVDRLPQQVFAAAVEALPIALHGNVGGSATVETKFPGKAGQKILVDVEAQRLGSKLRPVVHLIGPKGLQLAWAWPTAQRSNDCRLEAMLPDDGLYALTIHDAEYAAGTPSYFRVKIGAWATIDQVFPAFVAKGASQSVELLGTSASRNESVVPGQGSVLPLTWPKEGLWSGPRPFVRVSSHAELLEQAAATVKGQDLPAGVVGVSGRLSVPFEEDLYRVPAVPGTKLKFDVSSERLGSSVDVALAIRNEAGVQLARAEDSAGSLDPILEFTVPEKTTKLILAVIDAQGRGGPSAFYRLKIEPVKSTGQEDFRLVTPSQRLSLPVGGRGVMPVLVDRQGYQGGVIVSAEGLPGGYRLEGTMIPAEAEGALVTVHRDQAATQEAVVTRWLGKTEQGSEQAVQVQGHPLERLQPWLTHEIAVAPTTAKAADFQIDWRDFPSDAVLKPAKKLALPIKVTTSQEKAIVRLTLLTSQLVPLVNNQPDPNLVFKVEKAVELGPKITEGELMLLVPGLIASPVYDVAIQGELLTADKKTVIAVAVTPVRRLEVRAPLVVKLDGPPRPTVPLDAKKGATHKLAGTLERRDDLKSDVVLTLTGLPAGAKADPVTVKAADSVFAINVVFPPAFSPGEIAGLKLSATAVPDAKLPNVKVRARDLNLTLTLQVVPS